MPLEDNYETERDLKLSSLAIAEAITGYLCDQEKAGMWEFAVFLVDRKTGILHFVSDMPTDDSTAMLQAYIKRSLK